MSRIELPAGFIKIIKHQWGEPAWEEMESALQQPPITSVRLHPHRMKNFEIPGEPVPWCPYGKYLEKRPVFTLDPVFHAGGYYVQEAASMFLWEILKKLTDEKKDVKILDLCAAPGGKSSLIASFLDNQGLLVCNEVIKNRAYILKANMEKSGYHNIVVTNNDPKDFQSLESFFDIILIDAPCSGEGMFRKEPAAIRDWSEDTVQLCAARQKRIVADVLPCLKKDGYLIYSTCTYNDFENIDNVVWACREQDLGNVELPFDDTFPLKKIQKEGLIGYQLAPHYAKSEGLFFSILQKQGEDATRKIKPKNYFLKVASAKIPILQKYIETKENLTFFTDPNEDIHFFPSQYWEEINVLHNATRIIFCGINMGKWAKDGLIPGHGLALYLFLSEEWVRCDLPLEQSLSYLNKTLQNIDIEDKGWILITYKGLPLGWVKNLGNRINNYLPNEGKIRMDIFQ